MIAAVYIGTLAPFLFLLAVLRDEPKRLVLFILWGLSAALAAYFLNGWLQGAFGLSVEDMRLRVAPLVEETLKALPLLILLFTSKGERSYEAVKCGLAAGIGFSILENIAYLADFAPEGLRSAVGFAAVRSASACLLHGSLTALAGYAVRQMRLYRVRSAALFLGVLFAQMIIHGLFNRLASIPSAWPLCVLVPASLFGAEVFAWNFFGRKSTSTPAAILAIGSAGTAERTEK